jgi:hypothetical protein
MGNLSPAIDINGELIGVDEAQRLIRMIYNDSYKFAGEFHGMERSLKFRLNWPDEYRFADANWKNFVAAVRLLYTNQLADPKVPEREKRSIFLALVLERRISEGQETDTRLQLAPNTQQFEGDKDENKGIVEKFGLKPNLRALLMNSTADPSTVH